VNSDLSTLRMAKKRIAVVGGGASGIAAAYFLQAAGHKVEILESGSSLGGRIGSQALQGKIMDFGGKNIGKNYPLFRQFVKATGDFEFE
jgi:protoporphyrinogen/coproporphyrinogen III oxidase